MGCWRALVRGTWVGIEGGSMTLLALVEGEEGCAYDNNLE